MTTHINVIKFGGTSIQDRDAFARVAKIVKRKRPRAGLIVVVSTMSGVTDASVRSFRGVSAWCVEELLNELEEQFESHLRVGRLLSGARVGQLRDLIESTRVELRELLEHAAQHGNSDLRLHDEIVSHGERLAANLLTLAAWCTRDASEDDRTRHR